MGRTRHGYRCGGCGATPARWAGRCPACGEWNALTEVPAPVSSVSGPCLAAVPSLPGPRRARSPRCRSPRSTWQQPVRRLPGSTSSTGSSAGGLVPGSVTLLGGEPGIGKSTLLLQVLAARADAGHRVLLVSAEESAHQVRLRAERLGPLPRPALSSVLSPTSGGARRASPSPVPDLVVVDSSRRCAIREVHAAPAGSVDPGPRVRRQLVGAGQVGRRSPVSSSGMSPRTGPSPGPACSSTWSTPC